MTDVFSKEKRSQIMSSIQATETKPEILIRKYLFSKGFRFRKNVKSLPGSPDIVLAKYKTVIFVHGCFWHGHENCKDATLPKSNKKYWLPKISTNKRRDQRKKRELKKLGWTVITIWECSLKRIESREKTLTNLIGKINK
jgi:DNA mismatch endonuclease, patch repair protein